MYFIDSMIQNNAFAERHLGTLVQIIPIGMSTVGGPGRRRRHDVIMAIRPCMYVSQRYPNGSISKSVYIEDEKINFDNNNMKYQSSFRVCME